MRKSASALWKGNVKCLGEADLTPEVQALLQHKASFAPFQPDQYLGAA